MSYCSVVTVLAFVGLTKKHFVRYAILKNLSLRSPREQVASEYVPSLLFTHLFGSTQS